MDTEQQRLEALRSYRILDTDPERGFDDLSLLASYVCQTPIALLSLVDAAGEVLIVVRDPGGGFEPTTVADPMSADNTMKRSGRGVFLINEMMDDVRYADGGREVQMRKMRSKLGPG